MHSVVDAPFATFALFMLLNEIVLVSMHPVGCCASLVSAAIVLVYIPGIVAVAA